MSEALASARRVARIAWQHPVPLLLPLYLVACLLARRPVTGARPDLTEIVMVCVLLVMTHEGVAIARMALLMLSAGLYGWAALTIAQHWHSAGYLALYALQVAIMVNPAVHRRNAGRAGAWRSWPRRPPLRWAVAASAVAGLLITVSQHVFTPHGLALVWPQWTLVAFTFPYGVWLAFGRREEREEPAAEPC